MAEPTRENEGSIWPELIAIAAGSVVGGGLGHYAGHRLARATGKTANRLAPALSKEDIEKLAVAELIKLKERSPGLFNKSDMEYISALGPYVEKRHSMRLSARANKQHPYETIGDLLGTAAGGATGYALSPNRYEDPLQ